METLKIYTFIGVDRVFIRQYFRFAVMAACFKYLFIYREKYHEI